MFQRWFTAIVFCGAAGYTWHYNSTNTASQVYFPGFELLGYKDIFKQGELTWQVFGAIGVLFAIYAVMGTIGQLVGGKPDKGDEA